MPPAGNDTLVPADSGLRCPQCEYNLTGLTENRCPECGSAFDPEELRRVFSGAPLPIPGWEVPRNPSLLRRFLTTCRMSWFQPSEFGRRFPWSYDLGAAGQFWIVARGIATAILGIGVVGLMLPTVGHADRGVPLVVFGLAAAMFLSCSLVCEALVVLAIVLLVTRKVRTRPVRALPDSIPASTSWWGLVAFYSSFLIASALVFAFDAVASTCWSDYLPKHVVERAIVAGELGPLLWWSWALGSAIAARSVPSFGLLAARGLIPVIGAASFLLGRFCCCVP